MGWLFRRRLRAAWRRLLQDTEGEAGSRELGLMLARAVGPDPVRYPIVAAQVAGLWRRADRIRRHVAPVAAPPGEGEPR